VSAGSPITQSGLCRRRRSRPTARSADRVRALQIGFQMHVSAPTDPPEMVAAVRSLVIRDDQTA
jgi:hypothetical protein